MPYIQSKSIRKQLDGISDDLINVLKQEGIVGNFNYFIYRTAKHLCHRYKDYANFEGDIQQSLREIYRRLISKYENVKIISNGDVK